MKKLLLALLMLAVAAPAVLDAHCGSCHRCGDGEKCTDYHRKDNQKKKRHCCGKKKKKQKKNKKAGKKHKKASKKQAAKKVAPKG
ncbi:MAG: hypothetical protein M1549_00025 [Candidatus Dependentiae bacterium]|jgi:Ni/Co efflux regulator RcnB|nr:hypothetical protein [Candidatus Dependentiae bacterium]